MFFTRCVLSSAAVLITSMLKDLNAQERDTITFEVTVNYEGITYKWLKNGVEVKSSDRCQVRSKQLTHSLTIRNVHFGDGGEYQFVAGSAATAANLFVEGNAFSHFEQPSYRPLGKLYVMYYFSDLGNSLEGSPLNRFFFCLQLV